jgi:putative spermidine/putrescine transport system substrate-binding protein
MKALALFFSPEQQAHFPLTVDYGPANLKAFDTKVLSPEQIARINTSPENVKSQIKLDEAWWAENNAAVLERWDNFMQR